MTKPVDLSDFLSGFLAEAEEHLSSASANVIAVEQSLARGEPSPRAIRELFRSLHTIKGLSAMVGVEPIVDVAHAMETVLRASDIAGGVLSQAALEALVRGLSAVDERVRALSRGEKPSPAPRQLLEVFAALDERPLSPTGDESPALTVDAATWGKFTAAEKQQFKEALREGKRVLRVEFTPSPSRADGLNITLVRERLGKIADIVRVIPLPVPATEHAPGGLTFALFVATAEGDDPVAAAAGATGEALSTIAVPAASDISLPDLPDADPGSEAGPREAFVRVPVSRLDESLENLSALVVTRFKLVHAVSALAEQGADVRELSRIVGESARQIRDLRASIMALRMVSVRSLLERVPLLVRGLSRTTGKRVRLELNAGDAELDKAVAERVFPAIVHLVRNAVDHGIELPADRTKAGKPEEGVLEITCFPRANGQLEIRVEDDGAGIEGPAVARRLTLPPPRDDAELLEMITRPGVSTADRVSTTSGRGLGMDIVKRVVVTDLGGELTLESRRGAGTTFTLRIPLTITIVDAFSFVSGGERFVTPIGAVEEIVEVEPDRVVDAPGAKGNGRAARLLQRRGEALPLLSLDALFGLARAEAPALSRKALVVRRQSKQFAFEVDRMLGQQEVVVRPLEDPLVRVTGISGSTDLGDGRPTLVLDLVALSGTLGRGAETSP